VLGVLYDFIKDFFPTIKNEYQTTKTKLMEIIKNGAIKTLIA